MTLNKPAKIVLGIFTFLPLIFGIGSFIFAVHQIVSIVFSEDPAMPFMLLSYLSHVVPYLFILFPLYLGLGIFYLVHIIRNNYFDSEKRILWIIVLFILHAFAMPVYWYAHIWKEQTSKQPELKSDFDDPYESGTESPKF